MNNVPVSSHNWKFLVGFFFGMWVTCAILIVVANTVPVPSPPTASAPAPVPAPAPVAPDGFSTDSGMADVPSP